ncbi:hypothetical protein EJB05_31344, partial [Eragrostis curvula]
MTASLSLGEKAGHQMRKMRIKTLVTATDAATKSIGERNAHRGRATGVPATTEKEDNLFAHSCFPDFFAKFSSLRVLQLSRNRFEGWFSSVVLQRTNLVTIDLNFNEEISGILPNFSGDSSLEGTQRRGRA